MSNPNVVSCPAFSHFRERHGGSVVREVESEFRSVAEEDEEREISTILAALLAQPLWPLPADGVYLSCGQAARLYRTAQAISALVHVLDRLVHARGLALDYADEPDSPLGEAEESGLWSALIESSADLSVIAGDLIARRST